VQRWLYICLILLASCGSPGRATAPRPADEAWCSPAQACWPSADDWQRLGAGLTGRLEIPASPVQACQTDATSAACTRALEAATNPFALQELAGGTESTGWLGAWTATPSAYAVVAGGADDIAAAVRFAHDHRLRLVIKGTGHDYLGRSSAPDSLLIWTHQLRQVTVHDAFVADGCTSPAVPAVSVEAGVRWLEAYRAVTVEHGRYVQGGGCTSVGAAGGFLQGGGFGSWSKKYGIAAASLLEAEVVTADGARVIANACQHPDLFWALRGGGGGTFGVVTRATLMTHELPSHFGLVFGAITATSDAAFVELIEQFLRFYRTALNDEHWGEQVGIERDNTLRLAMAFQGLSAAEAEQRWASFRAWIAERADRFTIQIGFADLPGTKMWDLGYLQEKLGPGVHPDPDRPGFYWWAGDQDQVSIYWAAYHSRWIPLHRFENPAVAGFAKTLFEASRHWPVALHFNKGQAGAAADAVARGRETAVNPAVFDAAALAIMATGEVRFPGVAGHEPDRAGAEADRAEVDAAAALLRDATPGAGAYGNEADYFEADWQRSFWGANYQRLLAIKRRYDPDGLFFCHHCVGSEAREPPPSPPPPK
jgi:FAD/FMN-containing dehydrogenase